VCAARSRQREREMGILSRTVKAVWDEITKPDTFVKGDKFKTYVRSHLFPKDRYLPLQMTHADESNKKDFIENTKEPDFKLRSLKIGHEFFVEVKYHSNYYDGAVEWCKPYQLRRYKEIDREIPVFIVIGVGRQPGAPGQIFLVPVKDIEDSKLFRSFLVQYELPIDQSIVDSRLQRQFFGISYSTVNEFLQQRIF